jgi:hypothetical protein
MIYNTYWYLAIKIYFYRRSGKDDLKMKIRIGNISKSGLAVMLFSTAALAIYMYATYVDAIHPNRRSVEVVGSILALSIVAGMIFLSLRAKQTAQALLEKFRIEMPADDDERIWRQPYVHGVVQKAAIAVREAREALNLAREVKKNEKPNADKSVSDAGMEKLRMLNEAIEKKEAEFWDLRQIAKRARFKIYADQAAYIAL